MVRPIVTSHVVADVIATVTAAARGTGAGRAGDGSSSRHSTIANPTHGNPETRKRGSFIGGKCFPCFRGSARPERGRDRPSRRVLPREACDLATLVDDDLAVLPPP